MGLYKITFSCLGARREWYIEGLSKEDAEERLLERLYQDLGLLPQNVIVRKIEKRQSWICIAWGRVVNFFCK